MTKWFVYEYIAGWGGGLLFRRKELTSEYDLPRYKLLGKLNIGDLAKLDTDNDGIMNYTYFE